MKFLKKAATADPGQRRQTAAGAGASWLETLARLRDRFIEDRLAVTAGSLTFMTLIALVPLLAVMLAVFTAFPVFSSFQGVVEKIGRRQLSWPLGDNYPGRWRRGAVVADSWL
jgi:hypothetical protein